MNVVSACWWELCYLGAPFYNAAAQLFNMLETQLNGSTWDGRAAMLGYKTGDDWSEDIILPLVLGSTASRPHVRAYWRAALDLERALWKSENQQAALRLGKADWQLWSIFSPKAGESLLQRGCIQGYSYFSEEGISHFSSVLILAPCS